MNTRRLVLHLIVGLLTFLIGLTAAVALGGFDPLARLTRHGNRQYTIPPQSLSDTGRSYSYENYGGCRNRARARTAEMPYRVETLAQPLPPEPPPAAAIPVLPSAPFDEYDAPPPPPRAPRPRH